MATKDVLDFTFQDVENFMHDTNTTPVQMSECLAVSLSTVRSWKYALQTIPDKHRLRLIQYMQRVRKAHATKLVAEYRSIDVALSEYVLKHR